MQVLSKPVIAKINGTVIKFPSIMEAHRKGFQRTAVHRAIKHDKLYKNHKWEYDTRPSN